MFVETEPEQQTISVRKFVRTILRDYLSTSDIFLSLKEPNLNELVVNWSPSEQKHADEVLRIFREEDR